MLIAYSSLPGYVSNRDHFRGTWFIESICKVFMEKAKDTNLRDMLDEVGLVLSMYESERGTKQSFNYDVSLHIVQEYMISFLLPRSDISIRSFTSTLA